MRIAPGAHYSMGGLWIDYDSMSNVPGLFVVGEASCSDHGANRLGASSLMRACVDGWFTLPVTVRPTTWNHCWGPTGRCPSRIGPVIATGDSGRRAGVGRLPRQGGGSKPANEFHRQLGELLYEQCGVNRSADELVDAIDRIQMLRKEFNDDLLVTGSGAELNQELEKAGRVSDFIDLAELMCIDALDRDESCGGHFRVEHQTPTARRNATTRTAASCRRGSADQPGPYIRHDEPLNFTAVPLEQRNYKTK